MSTIYERIKQRRKELGLSADDVASSLGVSRATIYRYESSEIEKLPITILEPLAKILRTSPAYLMGWTNCELPIPSGDPQYNTEEQNLVNNYRELDERGKGAVQTTIEYELKVARSRLGTAPPSYSFAKASSRRYVPILGLSLIHI